MDRVQTYRRFPTLTGGHIPEWATYINGRYPQFKVHTMIGPAKGAITSYGHGIMYRYVQLSEGELIWMPVAVVNSGEAKTHSYRKIKPSDQLEAVVLFKIDEEEEITALYPNAEEPASKPGQ